MRIIFSLLLSVWFSTAFAQIIPLSDTSRQLSLDSWELNQARWEKVRDYAGRFELEVPGPLLQKVDTVETEIGPLTYHTYYFQPQTDRSENVLYMLSFCDYPVSGLHSDSTALVQDFLAATIETATESMGGELLYSSANQYGSYPGRIWRIDFRNGQASVRTRAYVIENRYYAIQTISSGPLRLNSSSDRFMDSFRVFFDQPEANKK